MSSISILHLSDIHFKKKEKEKRKNFREDVQDKLVKKILEHINDNKLQLDFVSVTGDIAYSGREYGEAITFFEKLRKVLPEETSILLVPGNHDVNREEVSKHFSLHDVVVKGGTESFLEDPKDRIKFISPKFIFFRQFLKDLKLGLYEGEEDYFWVKDFEDKQVSFLGLNTCWASENGDEGKITLGSPQVSEALKKSKLSNRILLVHHPFGWLNKIDFNKYRRDIFDDCKLVLHGHNHFDDALVYRDPSGACICLGAGASYTDEKSGSIGFQFMDVTFINKEVSVKVWPYFFDENKQKDFVHDRERWREQKGEPYFELSTESIQDKVEQKEGVNTPEPNFHIFEGYKQFVLGEHQFLPMKGFETNLRVPIEIEQVYVSMRGQVHYCDFENTLLGKRKLKEWSKQEQIKDLDIKGTFLTARKQKTKDIVILGDPGSGKTTLLQYILVMLAQGKGFEKLGLDNYLVPFFAPLRELKDPEKESFVDFICRVCCVEKYAVNKEDFVKILGDKGAIILLDGLDEVADKETRLKTCRWIDEARKQFIGVPFVITSRFSGYFGEGRLGGNVMELSIQDFLPHEVKAFLVNWFESVEVALHSADEENRWREKGREEALKLVEDINSSEHVKKLAVNPLMLQIIALVRRDRGTALPQRRADLYKECVNVLLEKWDIARGLKSQLRADESRQLLQPLALWLHEEEGRRSAPLADVLERLKKPLAGIGRSAGEAKKLLSNIRDRSGIFLEYSQGEYGFVHLGFQEYLAAEEIRNKRDIDLLVKNYGNRWWREVTQLSLGLSNPSIIEQFMKEILKTEGFKSEISLVTDAIEDSLFKPYEPLLSVLKSEDYSMETRSNVIRVLSGMGGDEVVSVLKEVLGYKEPSLVLSASNALKVLGHGEGLKMPAIVINKRDESEMILIPEGNFLYGSREDDKEADSDEKPQQTVYLPAYYMDKYPVTNRQYCQFLNHVNPEKGDLKAWIALSGKDFGEQCRIGKEGNKYLIEKGYEEYPVIYVSWYGAKAYGNWSGKRLPFEVEWEKAARGTDGRFYPWGNKFDKRLCNSSAGGPGHTTPVGSYPGDKSPYGCFDMAGNVVEWCGDWHDDNNDKTGDRLKGPDSGSDRVVRGGSWSYDFRIVRCACRSGFTPGDRYDGIGLRLSQDL